jgi:hypothetical protein
MSLLVDRTGTARPRLLPCNPLMMPPTPPCE